MKTKCITWALCAFICMGNLTFAQASSPRLFRTSTDIERAKAHIKEYPEMAASRDALAARVKEHARAWEKLYPSAVGKRDTGDWLALGVRAKRSPLPEVLEIATLYALEPSAELGALIREQMLVCAGLRRAKGTWREIGIHEGQRMLEFIKACDLVFNTGVLSGEEEKIIGDEIIRSTAFFEAWLLDNPATLVERDETYCLNINLYPAAVLGAVALYYPEHSGAKRWLAMAEEQIVKYLMTDFALDGGYGEGSSHYFQPCTMAILEFMNASKNAGVHDYSKDAAVVATIKRAFAWRTDLMGPDGRTTAIGDGHREQLGSADMELAALMFDDPDLAWAARSMVGAAAKRPKPAAYMETTHDLLVTDFSRPARRPTRLFSLYPWSGFMFSRSGWDANDNYIMFKYGPTWIGRRQSENVAVISGHAHEDAMEIELHWRGKPLLVDHGCRGVYADYLRYGGYWKATIAHNTVGLANPSGYDRLDGRYAEHVRKYGEDFLYERPQKAIGPADYHILAMGDTAAATISSVETRTFENVKHRRSLLWLRDNSLTVVIDRLESDSAQPYEWYLNPVGRLLTDDSSPVFGTDAVRLAVIPVNPGEVRTQIIQQGDANVPPYYVPLGKDYSGPDHVDGPDGYWANTSLMVESVNAKTADYLHILVPHANKSPYSESAMGDKGRRLSGENDIILVASANNNDKTLIVDEGAAFVRLYKQQNQQAPALYALYSGKKLQLDGQTLLSSKLKGAAWASRYSFTLTALVSLADKRASFGLPRPPMDRGLLLKRINSTDGGEVAAVLVEVSFKVNVKPARLALAQSSSRMPDLSRLSTASEGVSRSTALRFREREIPFAYDAKTGMVTVAIPAGLSQVVWEE